jgi:hypothetical protein
LYVIFGDGAAWRAFEGDASVVSGLLERWEPALVPIPLGIVEKMPKPQAVEPIADTLSRTSPKCFGDEGSEG